MDKRSQLASSKSATPFTALLLARLTLVLITIIGVVLILADNKVLKAVGATNVGGVIVVDTTWRAVDSPFIVTSDITVAPGVTLTVEPGVNVLFDGPYELYVRGKLIALGTSTSPITFQRNSAVNWRGIRSEYGTSIVAVRISYAIIEDCTSLSILGNGFTPSELSNSTIRRVTGLTDLWYVNATRNVFSVGGGVAARGRLTTFKGNIVEVQSEGLRFEDEWNEISDNIIRNNGMPVQLAMFQGSTGTEVLDLVFRNNLVEGNSGGGIGITRGINHGGSGSIRIIANNIRNNSGPGILCAGFANECRNGRVADNLISNNAGNGIDNVPGGSILFNDIIDNGGYGLSYLQPNNLPSTRSNNIRRNAHGGVVTSESTGVISSNNLIDNSGYAFENLGSNNLTVTGNYWGTTDPDQISVLIYDFNDNPSQSGLVTFTPFASAEISPAGPRLPIGPDPTLLPPDPGTPVPNPIGTSTPTVLPVVTSTRTLTSTATPISTSTGTPTSTSTSTSVPTGTSTATATETSTATMTNTPTITSTSTASSTPTITNTPTITPTPVIGLPPGFTSHYACRDTRDGIIRDLGVQVGTVPRPVCRNREVLVAILVNDAP